MKLDLSIYSYLAKQRTLHFMLWIGFGLNIGTVVIMYYFLGEDNNNNSFEKCLGVFKCNYLKFKTTDRFWASLV